MTSLGLFAEYKGIIGQHLKEATARWNQLQVFNSRCEILQQVGRRTDGFRCVVSLYTIFNTDGILLHLTLLSLGGLLESLPHDVVWSILIGAYVAAPQMKSSPSQL